MAISLMELPVKEVICIVRKDRKLRWSGLIEFTYGGVLERQFHVCVHLLRRRCSNSFLCWLKQSRCVKRRSDYQFYEFLFSFSQIKIYFFHIAVFEYYMIWYRWKIITSIFRPIKMNPLVELTGTSISGSDHRHLRFVDFKMCLPLSIIFQMSYHI